jgi:hypothetical protein
VCVFQNMSLEVENLSVDQRAAGRDRMRRALAAVPRNTPEATFLIAEATRLLDVQFRFEDALVAALAVEVPAGTVGCEAAISQLRLAIPPLAETVGRLSMAAQFDIHSVTEAMLPEDATPGVSPSQFKAVRTLFRQRFEAQQKAQEEAQRVLFRRRQAMAMAAATAAATSTAAGMPAPVPATGANSAALGVRLPGRLRYPCDACGVKGHWKEDGQCKPEDIRKHIQALAAKVSQDVLALPPPGTTGKVTQS